MISDNDLDAMLDTADFAQVATFTVSGNDVEVNGIFTEGSDSVQQYGIEIEAVDPNFACRTSELDGVGKGTAVTIGGSDYTVQRIVRVGTGMSVCYLKNG